MLAIILHHAYHGRSFWHALAIFFGSTNPAGRAYLNWSGWGGDIGQLAIIGGLVAIYRKHNCYQPRCWRLARHEMTDALGVKYHVCHRHHPLVPDKLTKEHLDGVRAWHVSPMANPARATTRAAAAKPKPAAAVRKPRAATPKRPS